MFYVFINMIKTMQADSPQHIWVLIARKLSGEATASELAELEDLLKKDPAANYSKEILTDVWSGNEASDQSYAENKFRELIVQMQAMGIDEGKFTQEDHYLQSTEPAGSRNRYSKKWMLVLSTVAVASLLGIAFFFKAGKEANNSLADLPAKNEISTKNGSKTSLVLPDGTKVWLNASSELIYDKNYGNALREVTLKGEAYFDVVKNAAKPFIIHTADMDIKVLGTAFNVKCYPGSKSTETSLVRGSIEVTLKDRTEKIRLKPNEKLILNHQEADIVSGTSGNKKSNAAAGEKPFISLSHLTLYPADNTVVETAWVQNKFVFSSETFEEVALKMERWYNVSIQFKSESLKYIHLTGSFERETITEALNALQFTAKFTYAVKNNVIVISKK